MTPFLFVPDYFANGVQLYRARGQSPFGALNVTYNAQSIEYKPRVP